MAVSSVINVATLPGNLLFSDGGIRTLDIVGEFVKSVVTNPFTGVTEVTYQRFNGDETKFNLPHGWEVSAVAPTFKYAGKGWYDTTTGGGLKIWDGSAWETVMGSAAVPAQDEGTQVVATPSALNFVGAGVTLTDVSGVATVTIPGGAVSAPTRPLYGGWKATVPVNQLSTLTTSSDSHVLTIPAASTAAEYFSIWRADVDGGDPDEVHLGGHGNIRYVFAAAALVTFTLGGTLVPGRLISTIRKQNTALWAGQILRTP